MTLSVPSFLAAATSASIPPAAVADVAVAALSAVPPAPPEPLEFLAGGEQAAMPMSVAVASAAAPVLRREGPFTQASSGHVDPGWSLAAGYALGPPGGEGMSITVPHERGTSGG